MVFHFLNVSFKELYKNNWRGAREWKGSGSEFSLRFMSIYKENWKVVKGNKTGLIISDWFQALLQFPLQFVCIGSVIKKYKIYIACFGYLSLLKTR